MKFLVLFAKKISDDSFLYLVPGININSKNDSSDQKYITPQEAMKRGADILIVGRGITKSKNILEECKKYQKIGWTEYLKRYQAIDLSKKSFVKNS